MNGWLGAAGLAAAFTFCIHTFVGGRMIAKPLLEGDLPAQMKTVLYGCWHFATICLAAFVVAFFLAAFYPVLISLAWFVSGIFSVLCLMALAIAVWGGAPFLRSPHWMMFSVTALLGFVGAA